MDTVGMVGLGNMGGRMARRLVEGGFTVVGHDPVAGRADAASADPAEVARRARIVLLSLPDSHVVEPVVRAVLDVAAEGATIVDLSTASPASTRPLHDEALARGVRYLDAGISGGAAAAEKGSLTIMVGGTAAALADLEGGLTSRLMTKDVALYVDLAARLGVPTLNAAGPLASFGLAETLGYGDLISNRVVDALGDVASGVRVHDQEG